MSPGSLHPALTSGASELETASLDPPPTDASEVPAIGRVFRPGAPGGSEEPPYKLTEKSPASVQTPENVAGSLDPAATSGARERAGDRVFRSGAPSEVPA